MRRQSEHFADYEAALKRLRDMGLVYPCFATRKDIADAIAATGIDARNWPVDPDGAPLYPGIYKDLAPAEMNRLMWEAGHTLAPRHRKRACEGRGDCGQA